MMQEEYPLDLHEIGDLVYLITDKHQDARIITGIIIRADGIAYELSKGPNKSWHYDYEFTKEPDELTSLLNNN